MEIKLGALAHKVDEAVRLTVLETLALMPDGQLNDEMLAEALDERGHRRPMDYIARQLDWLAENAAIRLTKSGDGRIAAILPRGLEHIERRRFMPGVRIPRLRL